MADEVEVKFLVADPGALERKLREIGFWRKTASTFERNTLYDTGDKLRSKGEILRLRQYGEKWKLTHKAKGKDGRHKTRAESETAVSSGEEMDAILRALGFAPSFVYEKYRAEWSDGQGDAVVDRTPIGNLAELEGKPDWIDAIAAKLGIAESQYITKSYGQLFEDWREKSGSKARNMSFEEVKRAW
jgi:adenylate cyclase class 2